MQKTIRQVISPLTISIAVAFSSVAIADPKKSAPNFAGNITAGVLNVNNRDLALWAFKAEAGVGGSYIVEDGLRVRYDLIADFANAINSVDDQTWTPGAYRQNDGEIYVRTARMLLLTNYGGFGIQPRVPSGYWRQIYRNIDVFEYNRLHGQTGQNAIFGQNEQASNVLTYGTPKFHGFQFIGAMATVNAHNDEDADVVTGRLVYDQGPLNFGIGHTQINTPVEEGYDLYRTSFGIGYDFAIFQLGGVYEHNDDQAEMTNRSFDAWGVNVSTRFNESWSASLGYAENDKPNDADNSAIVGIVRHHFNKEVYAFLEAGSYAHTDNNVAMGISTNF